MAANRSFSPSSLFSALKPSALKPDAFFFFFALAVPLFIVFGRAVAEIAMALVSVHFLYRCVRDKNWSWTRAPWVRLAALVWVYLLVIALFADFDAASAIKRAVGWIRFPLFTVAFASLLPLHDKERTLTRWFLIVLLSLTVLDTVVQFLTGTSLTGHGLPRLEGRLGGPFGNHMVVGTYVARIGWIAIGFFFTWSVTQNSFAKKYLLPIAFTAALGLTVLLSGERVALAVFALAGLVFWLFSKELRKTLLVFALLGAIGGGALLWFNPTLHDRFIRRTAIVLEKGDDSSYGRVWHNAMVTWKMSPVFGVGPRNYLAACETLGEQGGFKKEAFYVKEFNCARHPHNPYVEWLIETGTVGFLLFIGLVGLWFRNAWHAVRTAKGASYFAALGAFCALIPFLWPLMSSMSFFSNWSAILFWWVLAFSQYTSLKR